jgi:hypothetical protein
MSISKYPRVRVHWIDILGDTGWADEDEFQEMQCSTCVSEGHLFHKDDNAIMTFASYEIENGEVISYGDRNVYPIGVVRKSSISSCIYRTNYGCLLLSSCKCSSLTCSFTISKSASTSKPL